MLRLDGSRIAEQWFDYDRMAVVTQLKALSAVDTHSQEACAPASPLTPERRSRPAGPIATNRAAIADPADHRPMASPGAALPGDAVIWVTASAKAAVAPVCLTIALCRSCQVAPDGIGNGRGAGAKVELAEDIADVVGGGADADKEGIGDLGLVMPSARRHKHLLLSRRGGDASRGSPSTGDDPRRIVRNQELDLGLHLLPSHPAPACPFGVKLLVSQLATGGRLGPVEPFPLRKPLRNALACPIGRGEQPWPPRRLAERPRLRNDARPSRSRRFWYYGEPGLDALRASGWRRGGHLPPRTRSR